MADGLNRVMLLGNLGADPELRSTNSGESVLRLRVATNERYQDREKNWQNRTEWHSVTVWGKRAEALHRILSKGSNLFIEGALRTSSYDDKEGVKRYKTEIVAKEIILTGKAPGGDGGGSYDGPRGGSGGSRRSGEPTSYGQGGNAGERGKVRGQGEGPPDDGGGGFGGDDDIPFLSLAPGGGRPSAGVA